MNDTLATFLTSSLNVELVHVILESITKLSKGQVKDGMNRTNIQDSEYKKFEKLEMNAIKIKDPDRWTVAKLPDFLV